jgi:hypothetical protein
MAKSNLPAKIILGIFILALIALIGDLVRVYNQGSGRGQVNIVVPWGLIAIFISFYLFKEHNRVRKAKRENRREYMNERRQELLENLLKKNKKATPPDNE